MPKRVYRIEIEGELPSRIYTEDHRSVDTWSWTIEDWFDDEDALEFVIGLATLHPSAHVRLHEIRIIPRTQLVKHLPGSWQPDFVHCHTGRLVWEHKPPEDKTEKENKND